ncbi:MAG: AMP-binding protein, partial [Bacteroidota bacterium]
NNKQFVIVFWSCILSGVIPVPVTVGQNKEHRIKLSKICGVLNSPLIITDQNNLQRIRKASDESGQAKKLSQIVDQSLLIENLLEYDVPLKEVHQPSPDSLAFIQFSSGSTGLPKGVKLTHANLMTNINDIETAGHHTNQDKMFSWMPLTHDMGLIGFHLHPVNCQMNHCIMATNLFIRRPALWLDKVTEHAATILCSPNFGYNYILKHCVGKEQTWDLSSVRFVYNGAEPISIQLCKDFNAYAAHYQLNANAMRPVYGLAEACLAVAFSPPYRPLKYLSVDRQHLAIGDAIQTTGTDLISFMGVGSTVPESKVRIVNLDGKEVEEGVNGVIEIAGRNVTNGYYNNQAESDKVISADGWLQTGDLGFLYEGELYITGRQKDIIFVNGQNVFPYDVENALIEIEQIELNKVVVAGYTDEELQSEKVIVFVFHRGKVENFLPVIDKVETITKQQFGFVPNAIIPVKDIPRTTSGKLQRYKLLTQYKNQQFVSEEKTVSELIKAQADHDKSELSDVELLRVCWRDVLKHENFVATDSFFQLGGSSLGAGELSMSINKVLNVEVTIEEVYEHPTFDQMVNLIQGKSKQLYRPLEKKALSFYPLSSAQKGIYYAWEVNRNSTAYNLPVAFRIADELDIPKLETSLQAVIASHKIFHTRLSAEGDFAPQFEKYAHTVSLHVKKIDQSELDQVLTSLVKPFDLLHEPLFRMTLLEVEGGLNCLFLDFHHIISDGVSVSKFIDSVQKLYNGKATVEGLISTDYGDFVHYEQHIDTDKQQDSKAFWLQQLSGELPKLNLPV